MSTISSAHRQRIANALGTSIELIPSDTDALVDLLGPMLADHTRTRSTLATDCEAFGISTTDADGPRSLYQMTGDVVKRWRSAADDSSDLAEIRTRLTAAGYVPAPGETVGDLVARALRDTLTSDRECEEAERETEILRDQLSDARTLSGDLAAQLNHAASLITRMSATISRLT